MLAAGDRNGQGRVWDLLGGAGADSGSQRAAEASEPHVLLTLRFHTRRIIRLAFGPNGLRLGTAKVWDSESGQGLVLFSLHVGPASLTAAAPDAAPTAIAFSSDRALFGSSSSEGWTTSIFSSWTTC